jgi:hypothetical protein
MNAQTEEPESKVGKMLRLTKTADDNPTDWKAQLEAGHFLLDKENGMYNQSQAGKYYERLYHLTTDYNKEIPDSVIQETIMMLITVASDKKNIDKALFYIDEMEHAKNVGVDIRDEVLNSLAFWGVLYSMIKENHTKTLSYIMELRERLAQNGTPGIEYTDAFTSIVFEKIIEKYRDMFGDKVIEMTFDGKKYYMISLNDWNIEKPLMGWMVKSKENPLLLYGEDGKVYDDKYGQMEYSFNYYKDGIKPKDGANTRLVTVTPEHRQQMVEAYRSYMKKTKKKSDKK